MKHLLIVLNIITVFFFVLTTRASTPNCTQILKKAGSMAINNEKRQAKLGELTRQIEISQKVIEDYHKNCQGKSNQSCDSGAYKMVSGQMSTLTENQQRVRNEMLDAIAKRQELMKSLKTCK